jgi:hypothetical protein
MEGGGGVGGLLHPPSTCQSRTVTIHAKTTVRCSPDSSMSITVYFWVCTVYTDHTVSNAHLNCCNTVTWVLLKFSLVFILRKLLPLVEKLYFLTIFFLLFCFGFCFSFCFGFFDPLASPLFYHHVFSFFPRPSICLAFAVLNVDN